MEQLHARIGRILSASALAAVLAACAGNRTEETADAGSASDTAVYIGEESESASRMDTSGTAEPGGTGVGGAGEPMPPTDPTASDTAGEYGDPNAWPTGPLPGDTGIGGAGSPMPDTVWMDTLAPEDTFGTPGDDVPGGTPGGGSGPDVY